jgi:uncharacterized protein DUF4255/IPT/TIG domain-containing protein
MSNPFAIATVTAVLDELLGPIAMVSGLAGTLVVSRAPHLVRVGDERPRRLNLFLYQVTPNAALRNAELPVRDSRGDLVSQPVLALNLYYLITAYGADDDETEAQLMLAHAMSLLHDNPVLPRKYIRKVVTARSELNGSDLAEQVEMVKLTPHPLSADDLFKLWSAFQTGYRLSTAYQAAVVLIERPHPTRPTLPVREPRVYVRPFDRPVIRGVSPQVAKVGATLKVHGNGLASESVVVRIGSASPVSPVTAAPDELTAVLPSSLTAGINTVQVIHQTQLGDPPVPHAGIESNQAAFMLVPTILPGAPATIARGATLTLPLSPPVGRAQRVALLLGDRAIPIPPRLPDTPAPAASLDFPIPPDFPVGTFLMRVRVDDAESELATDPVTKRYTAPTVAVT